MSTPPLVGILLAAGASRRFGSDKLRHPLPDGTPIAVAAARRLLAACDACVAVVRPEGGELAGLLAAEGCRIVVAPDAAAGMGHSLAAGVRAAPDAAGWLIGLADMPFVATASICRVVEALRNGASIAAPVHGERRGHPVGFSQAWYEELAVLRGDAGAKTLLQRHAAAVLACPVDDPGILHDVDNVSDVS